METIHIQRTIQAPLEKVWAVAGNFLKPPGHSISITFRKDGNPDLHGAGAERIITIGNVTLHERLESVVPLSYFTYTILSGAPVKNYQGRVEFVPKGDATAINWSASFSPKFPGTGWIARKVNSKSINSFLDALESIK